MSQKGRLVGQPEIQSLTGGGLDANARRAWLAPPPLQSTGEAREWVLRFADGAKGTVVVTDALTGDTVHVFGEQGSGFIRGVLRGMGRDRHMRSIPMDAPYELNHWTDGSLSLTDTATNRVVELGAFGPTNRGTFEGLLK